MIPEEHIALEGTRESKNKTIQDLSTICFHTPSEWAKKNLFIMEANGSFTCAKQYRIDRFGSYLFDSYLAIFTLSGSGTIVTPFGKSICVQDDVVILDCNETHTYYANEHWKFLWFHFSGAPAKAFMQLLFNDRKNVFHFQNSQSVSKLFLLLVQYRHVLTLNDEVAISSYIHQLLSQTYIAAHTDQLSDMHSSLIKKAIEYIEQHYESALTVDEIANHLNTSKSGFCHLFRAETGFSPYDYILTVRINKAKHLLQCTEQSVSEIAWSVGFKSSANFIRAFRQKTDLTPNHFRNSISNP